MPDLITSEKTIAEVAALLFKKPLIERMRILDTVDKMALQEGAESLLLFTATVRAELAILAARAAAVKP
jgi:hypothetical protein